MIRLRAPAQRRALCSMFVVADLSLIERLLVELSVVVVARRTTVPGRTGDWHSASEDASSEVADVTMALRLLAHSLQALAAGRQDESKFESSSESVILSVEENVLKMVQTVLLHASQRAAGVGDLPADSDESELHELLALGRLVDSAVDVITSLAARPRWMSESPLSQDRCATVRTRPGDCQVLVVVANRPGVGMSWAEYDIDADRGRLGHNGAFLGASLSWGLEKCLCELTALGVTVVDCRSVPPSPPTWRP